MDTLPQGLSAQEIFDRVLVKPALPRVILLVAIGGSLFLSLAFMRPLSNFTRFIDRWFKSDTTAFLTLAILGGMVAVFLYWLHIFLFVITIGAAGALARIDLQTDRFSDAQSFWILSTTSLSGLVAGWALRVLI